MSFEPEREDKYIPIDAGQIEDFRAQMNKHAKRGYFVRYTFMKPGYYCALLERGRR